MNNDPHWADATVVHYQSQVDSTQRYTPIQRAMTTKSRARRDCLAIARAYDVKHSSCHYRQRNIGSKQLWQQQSHAFTRISRRCRARLATIAKQLIY
jgi:hypothetical protein